MTPENNSAATYLDDEPAVQDTLGRARHVDALSHMARTCNTPMVIGIYGGWGVGKTSLMKHINKQLTDASNKANNYIKTVEFEAWQHQYDPNPVVALLQTMLATFDEDHHEQIKTIFKTAMRALMSVPTLNRPVLSWVINRR